MKCPQSCFRWLSPKPMPEAHEPIFRVKRADLEEFAAPYRLLSQLHEASLTARVNFTLFDDRSRSHGRDHESAGAAQSAF